MQTTTYYEQQIMTIIYVPASPTQQLTPDKNI